MTQGEGEDLEKLKREFIVSEEEERAMLRKILVRMTRYARVSKDGYVYIERKDLSKRLKILLVVMARYIAGLLDESIPKEVNLDEVATISGVTKKEASARLSEFAREGLIVRTNKGEYRAMSLYAVEKFLDLLERKKGKSGDKD